jgi:hypothetical protein
MHETTPSTDSTIEHQNPCLIPDVPAAEAVVQTVQASHVRLEHVYFVHVSDFLVSFSVDAVLASQKVRTQAVSADLRVYHLPACCFSASAGLYFPGKLRSFMPV